MYWDADPVFRESGMLDESGAGVLYDTMGFFAYFWGWTTTQFLNEPLRRRKKMIKALAWQMKKFFPKNSGGMGQPGKVN